MRWKEASGALSNNEKLRMITLTNSEEKKGLGVINNAKRYRRSTRLALLTVVYGIWLQLNQGVLVRYLIYQLVQDLISPQAIAATFVFVGAGSLIGIAIDIRGIKALFFTMTTVLWSTWAISFFITPPPNSVWIFSAFIAYLSYEAIWVDRT